MTATNIFWYRSKTLELDFLRTKRARYSTLSLRPRNTAPAWGCVSAERLLRPTVAGSGLRTTILAEQVFISRWLSPRTARAWMPGATPDLLREFGFADRAFCRRKSFSHLICVDETRCWAFSTVANSSEFGHR